MLAGAKTTGNSPTSIPPHRVALGIEYDGSAYSGWQIQAHTVRTVQETLQTALASIALQPIKLFCAGRTDASVHATGQVVHFDSTADRDQEAWLRGTNSYLPIDVRVRWAQPVAESFHARFSALSRRYLYVIDNQPVRSALFPDRLSWFRKPLDVDAMREAANYLVGEHDFTSYRTVHCQAHTPVRTVQHLKILRRGSRVFIDIQANAFLHHMVRNIAGVLMAIGAGEAPANWAREVLLVRNRCRGGVTGPPQGLYLVGAEYPAEFGLPYCEPNLPFFD